MGTWGSGNFEDDTSADYLSEYISGLIDEISKVINNKEDIEPDEYDGVTLPCKIEILTILTEKKWVGCLCPEIEIVNNWMKKYLQVYDEYYKLYDENINFIEQRRKVIEETFNNYILAIKKYKK